MGSNPVKATICPRGGTVDPLVLETSVARRVGSSPTEGTKLSGRLAAGHLPLKEITVVRIHPRQHLFF